MEDIRTYRSDDDTWPVPDEDRTEWSAAADNDEPPFHIPRD